MAPASGSIRGSRHRPRQTVARTVALSLIPHPYSYVRSLDRPLRARAHGLAGLGDRSLQHPLHLLHAGAGGRVQAPRRHPHVRGDRASGPGRRRARRAQASPDGGGAARAAGHRPPGGNARPGPRRRRPRHDHQRRAPGGARRLAAGGRTEAAEHQPRHARSPEVPPDHAPRRAAAGARGDRGRPAGRVPRDQAQQRGRARPERGGRGPPGPLRAPARPEAAVHRVHAARRGPALDRRPGPSR